MTNANNQNHYAAFISTQVRSGQVQGRPPEDKPKDEKK
jgi:hypothetical protein